MQQRNGRQIPGGSSDDAEKDAWEIAKAVGGTWSNY